MTTDTLEFPPWSMVKTVILCSNFTIKSNVNHFDHGKFVFWHGHGQNGYFWLDFLSKFEINHLDHEKFGFWPWSVEILTI